MPNIRSLTISIPWYAPIYMLELGEGEVASIIRVLEHHGLRLTSLALDTLHSHLNMGKTVKDVLTLCPNLEVLRCTDCALSAIAVLDAPFLPLRKLELFPFTTIARHVNAPETEPLEDFFVMSRNRGNFPRLESIALYDRTFPSTPRERFLSYIQRPIVFQYFLAWTRQFREMGITLLNVVGEPFISADRERWNGWTEHGNNEGSEGGDDDDDDDTDPEDTSYVYESDSDTEVSSDSDSEVSVHTVESTEALERFEHSLQVNASDVESSGSEVESDGGDEGTEEI